MPDSVLQGIANLVAIGLERARAQDFASQIEAARQSEKLRTTLLDAMAHEFKTPLTSVMAATTSLLADPDQPGESRHELLKIADQEVKHLKELIDDAVEMGRLDSANIEVQIEPSNVAEIVREVVAAMEPEIDGRPVKVDLRRHSARDCNRSPIGEAGGKTASRQCAEVFTSERACDDSRAQWNRNDHSGGYRSWPWDLAAGAEPRSSRGCTEVHL